MLKEQRFIRVKEGQEALAHRHPNEMRCIRDTDFLPQKTSMGTYGTEERSWPN